MGRAGAVAAAETLFEEARRATPGDVQIVGHRFGRLFGPPSDPAEQRKRRFARYEDADGTVRGLAIYRLVERAGDFTGFTVELLQLVTTTHDAYRGLWRFLLDSTSSPP